MGPIQNFCILKNSLREEYVLVKRDIIYELNEDEEAVHIGKSLRKGSNGRILYKNTSGKLIPNMKIVDTDDNREVLKKRWDDTSKRVRVNKDPYTPSTANSKVSAEAEITEDINERGLKKKIEEKLKLSAGQPFRDRLSRKTEPVTPAVEVDKLADMASASTEERREPLKNITNQKRHDDKTPCRIPSNLTEETGSKHSDEAIINRQKMRAISGIPWKRRMEETVMSIQGDLKNLKKKKNIENDVNKADVENTTNLDETTVIDKGQQITTINNVKFNTSQMTNVLVQKTMKKRLCCLVPVVWSPEIIEKKYIDPPKNVKDYVLIDDRDKFKFDQLCLHLQGRRKINYARGGDDDLELHSKSWLGRRCTELRAAAKKKSNKTIDPQQ